MPWVRAKMPPFDAVGASVPDSDMLPVIDLNTIEFHSEIIYARLVGVEFVLVGYGEILVLFLLF